VFGRLGYRRTRMADVATEARLSSGAVYLYVDSKEALFHLVFVYGFGLLGEGVPSIPLAAPPFAETLEVIGTGLRTRAATPRLRAALAEDDPADIRDELVGIIEERYAMTERLWPILAVVERCAIDLPDLEALYFGRRRPAHITQLSSYLEQRAATGHLRVMPDAMVAARLVTEAITWFAWHRREDRDAAAFDDDRARRTVIEFVCSALIRPTP